MKTVYSLSAYHLIEQIFSVREELKPLHLKMIGLAKLAMGELSPIQFDRNWASESTLAKRIVLLAKRDVLELSPIPCGQITGLIELSAVVSRII